MYLTLGMSKILFSREKLRSHNKFGHLSTKMEFIQDSNRFSYCFFLQISYTEVNNEYE